MKEAQEGCRFELEKIVVPPRPYLEPRVLDAGEARAVKRACAKELAATEETKAVAATIVDFAAFCALLAKPENHVKIKGQFVEREVRASVCSWVSAENWKLKGGEIVGFLNGACLLQGVMYLEISI